MRKAIVGFLCGALFAAGLVVSQMTLPSRVIGFLDFFGDWDPTLAFVMGGAIAVYLPIWYFTRGRKAPIGDKVIPIKLKGNIDPKLLMGASLFGIGWGLSGICPGPALALLGRPRFDFVIFVLAMVAGMMLYHAMDRPRSQAPPADNR